MAPKAMLDNTLTLRMSGRVSLKKFARALDRFYALVNGLSVLKRARDVEWIISDLTAASAFATVEGIGEPDHVITVIDAYFEIGEALQRGDTVPYPKRVTKPAYDLRSFVGNGIESVTFDTFRGDSIIGAAPTPLTLTGEQAEIQATPGRQIVGTTKIYQPAYGSVSGQVETLARRTGLRFVLYDTVNNKAVSCYVAEGQEALLRDIWGSLVTVEGLVTRDPLSGRPTSVRQITSITKRPERTISYRDARGASPYSAVLPEDLIRRVRDGW
jgi:hypothetical protein